MSNPFGKFPWTLPMEQKKSRSFESGLFVTFFYLKIFTTKPTQLLKTTEGTPLALAVSYDLIC